MNRACTCPDCVSGKIPAPCTLPAHEFTERCAGGFGCWNCGAVDTIVPSPGAMTARDAFRLSFGLVRADREAARIGWETTSQRWAANRVYAALQAANDYRARDRVTIERLAVGLDTARAVCASPAVPPARPLWYRRQIYGECNGCGYPLDFGGMCVAPLSVAD